MTSSILLIHQLRSGAVPGVVSVHYALSGKHLGDYRVAFVHMSTLELRPVPESASLRPLYIPNPLTFPACFTTSGDGRTFVDLKEGNEIIFSLTFHNEVPTNANS